jgi:hypothetical protein
MLLTIEAMELELMVMQTKEQKSSFRSFLKRLEERDKKLEDSYELLSDLLIIINCF